MLVITAHRHDQVAQALVSRWATSGASLLTCADLSANGWRYYQGSPANSRALVGGQKVAVEHITGVLNRLTCVFEQELAGMVARDRSYAAAEMTAFLCSWLADLKCPVLNRVTPTCLAGPYWRPERWVAAAACVGIPVRPVQRRAAFPMRSFPERPDTTIPSISAIADLSVPVTIVGKRCFGAVDETLARQARQLAEMASVELLTVHLVVLNEEHSFCALTCDQTSPLTAR